MKKWTWEESWRVEGEWRKNEKRREEGKYRVVEEGLVCVTRESCVEARDRFLAIP